MGPSLVFCCRLFLVLISCHCYLCFGCVQMDRRGLLEVKASINYPNGSSLSSWDEGGGDCCTWEGVVCSLIIGRVVELDLHFQRGYDLPNPSWYVNTSAFAAFDELRLLNLSDNFIIGWQQNEGYETLSILQKLELLDLSFNQLNTSIIPYLVSLKRLEVLDLSYNRLAGTIPPSLGSLSSLKALSLRDNQLNGSLPVQGLCRLQKLQELDISGNELNGGLPPCLGKLSSLRILDLSDNKFAGFIPSSIITDHTSLVFLSISHNRFEGAFSLNWFANHTKLKMIDLTCDDTKLEIETEHQTWFPSFQLEVMYLSNCRLNKYQGAIPSFLSTQYALKAVDLSHNRMSGNFPTWLLRNNTRLEYLNLMNNSITGPFDLPSHLNMSIHFLEISNNRICGLLPANIGMLLPELQFVNMSGNDLKGGIPSSLGDMRRLRYLDLSNNNLTGEIPSNLTSLEILLLDNNQFTAIIPNFPSSGSNLTRIGISNNRLSGMLPSWMGEILDLQTLILGGNNFHGPIPISFCQLSRIEILDISQNNLSGSMPSCFNLSYLTYLHLQGNKLTGSISSGLLQSPKLVTLDIRYNNLKGILPSWIGEFSELRALLLRGNHFHGSIPVEYCHLSFLRILDLSSNNLSGTIPSCFTRLPFGITGAIDYAFIQGWTGFFHGDDYSIDSLLHKYLSFPHETHVIDEKKEIQFTTKYRPETYKGDVLNFMSGIDLSWNQLSGEIPPEIGNLRSLYALNLSHNLLTGPIPKSFSNLMALESLDLSQNQLSGSIPSQLTELTFLSVFTVAHNNLIGSIPKFTAQFSTFSESDYQGNPGLCGPPLNKTCNSTLQLPTSTSMEEEDGSDDLIAILPSFFASYIVCFFGFIILLYLNKSWREMYFQAMDRYLLVRTKNCFLGVYVWILIRKNRIWKKPML